MAFSYIWIWIYRREIIEMKSSLNEVYLVRWMLEDTLFRGCAFRMRFNALLFN